MSPEILRLSVLSLLLQSFLAVPILSISRNDTSSSEICPETLSVTTYPGHCGELPLAQQEGAQDGSEPGDVPELSDSAWTALAADLVYKSQPMFNNGSFESFQDTQLRFSAHAKETLGFLNVTVAESPADSCGGRFYVLNSYDTVVTIGSKGLSHANLSAVSMELSMVELMDEIGTPQEVVYVLEKYWTCYERMREALAQNFTEYSALSKRMIFIGYGEGAALAQLGALDYAVRYSSTVDAVLTFGGPAVGDASWTTLNDKRNISGNTTRVVVSDDISVQVNESSGLRQVGPAMELVPGVSCQIVDRPTERPDPAGPHTLLYRHYSMEEYYYGVMAHCVPHCQLQSFLECHSAKTNDEDDQEQDDEGGDYDEYDIDYSGIVYYGGA